MIHIIAAMTKSGVIGKNNTLPWHIPEELKNFKRLTEGSTVIMGLKTFESIGRPLPNRNNIVLSPVEQSFEKVTVCTSIDQALSLAQTYDRKIFIIGGAYTYQQFLPLAHRMYISYIKNDYDGDVYFPHVDFSSWKLIEKTDFEDFELCIYER